MILSEKEMVDATPNDLGRKILTTSEQRDRDKRIQRIVRKIPVREPSEESSTHVLFAT